MAVATRATAATAHRPEQERRAVSASSLFRVGAGLDDPIGRADARAGAASGGAVAGVQRAGERPRRAAVLRDALHVARRRGGRAHERGPHAPLVACAREHTARHRDRCSARRLLRRRWLRALTRGNACHTRADGGQGANERGRPDPCARRSFPCALDLRDGPCSPVRPLRPFSPLGVENFLLPGPGPVRYTQDRGGRAQA